MFEKEELFADIVWRRQTEIHAELILMTGWRWLSVSNKPGANRSGRKILGLMPAAPIIIEFDPNYARRKEPSFLEVNPLGCGKRRDEWLPQATHSRPAGGACFSNTLANKGRRDGLQ